MDTITYFLGIAFGWRRQKYRNLDVHIDQTTFYKNLVYIAGLSHDTASVKATPYHNGHSIDCVNHVHLTLAEKAT